MSQAASTYQVGPDTRVALTYSAFDAEGEEVDRSLADAPLTAVFGYGQLLPAVEQALEGLAPGQARSLVLNPEQAFGHRDPRAVLEVDRSEFPGDVAAGDHYEMENQHGEVLVFRVLEVAEDFVVLDTNHPLAGQRVRVELTVCDVRPATSEELASAQDSLVSPEGTPETQLIGVERLLRGSTRS